MLVIYIVIVALLGGGYVASQSWLQEAAKKGNGTGVVIQSIISWVYIVAAALAVVIAVLDYAKLN